MAVEHEFFPALPPNAPSPPDTGRRIVTLRSDIAQEPAATAQMLRELSGFRSIANSGDFAAHAVKAGEAEAADALVFAHLGLIVVQAGADVSALAADPRVLAVERELTLYAINLPQPAPTLDYLRGYRDGVSDLYERCAGAPPGPETALEAPFEDSDAMTWGLAATGVDATAFTGAGVKLCVLDTGIDLRHPDVKGRAVTSESFVARVRVQDGQGHGTHCAGTATGPVVPSTSRRYGIASGAELFIGKVLSNQGSGTDSTILAGINWAVANGCKIISMSLGADVDTVSVAYETAGRRALNAGSLIIAAAGNNADRKGGRFGFVGVPANSASIVAVAALDGKLQVANFSARSNKKVADGGQIDLAAPGVDVYSSWQGATRYRIISGTSMATPHVAGIAALTAEATGASGAALWQAITAGARRIVAPAADVGAGLVQAPITRTL